MAKQSSGYNKDKDQELARAIAYDGERTQLVVSIHRYAGGQPKIQIDRLAKDRQQAYEQHPRLGRLTYEEFAAVARTVKKFSEERLFE